MGITLGQETVTIERRYTQILINKNTSSQETEVTVAMTYEDGFYDPNTGEWKAINSGQVYVSGDAVRFLMGLTGTDLSATTGTVGELIDRLAYGVLTEQIRTKATLTVNVTDDQGTPVTNVYAHVYDRNGNLVFSPQVGITTEAPIMFGARVSVIVDGFEPAEQIVDIIGDTVVNIQLTPVTTTTTTTTTTSNTSVTGV